MLTVNTSGPMVSPTVDVAPANAINFSDVRSLERWPVVAFFHSSKASFKSKKILSNGLHTVFMEGLPIDILLQLKQGRPIVFFLNGATPRSEDIKLPIFSGLSVVPPGEVSRVYINDPSLYLDPSLALGWYAGSAHLDLQSILPELIRKIVDQAEADKLIFVGGSGGGFASLFYSRLFPGSLAVPWNPQTNILDYVPMHVAKYAKSAFHLADMEAARVHLPRHIEVDVRSLYGRGDSENYVLYLQNESDSHVNQHLVPFLRELGCLIQGSEVPPRGLLSKNLYVHIDEWGPGHAQPKKGFLRPLLAGLISHQGGWDTLFNQSNLGMLIESAREPAQE